jgi:hypothetical protein
VIINDLNDNLPKFGQYVLSSFSNYNLISVTQPLTSIINENEIGPIFFNNIADNILIAYDLDLGENASFVIQVDFAFDLPVLEVYRYFLLDTSTPVSSSVVGFVQGVSNVNLVYISPIDFDTLNLPSTNNFNKPGVTAKAIKFNVSLTMASGSTERLFDSLKIVAKETDSISRFQSEPLQFIIYIQDVNDNKPVFEREGYSVNLNENANNGTFDLEILSFKVTDKDMGIYGVDGLSCYIRGEEAEKYGAW